MTVQEVVLPVFGSRYLDSCSGGWGPSWSLEEITEAINRQLNEDFSGVAQLRYVDFDSADLNDYPDVKQKVEASELEPGVIMIDGNLRSIWQVPYSQMLVVFEKMGAQRTSKASI